MKSFSAFLFLLLAGCSREPAPSVEAAKPEPASTPDPPRNEIVLDSKQLNQTTIRTEEVRVAAQLVAFESPGKLAVNENRTWRVGAITEGRIVQVAVVPGDLVRKDQVLAGMHSHEIHEGRAEYRKALSELGRLKSQLAYAQKQRDRMKRLYDLKAASLEQLDHAEAEVRNSAALIETAESEVVRTRLHLTEFLQVGIDDHDEHKEGDTEHEGDLIPIKSPAAGVVLSRSVTAGSVASLGEELFVISDLSSLWMIAAVQEEHLGRLRTGSAVRVRVQAFPERSFPGRISRIGDQLDPQTRTAQVRIELSNPTRILKPEMYGTVEISGGASESAIFISQSAIQQVNGQSTVFVENAPGRFEARTIVTGPVLNGAVRIAEGLRPGDRVVVEGSYILKSQLLKASLSEEE